MPTYMITYDLNNPGQRYDELIQTIKDLSLAWCTFWKSSYLINSNLRLSEIQNKIEPHLDSNDSLIIIEVKQNYQGWLTENQWKFIRENIF